MVYNLQSKRRSAKCPKSIFPLEYFRTPLSSYSVIRTDWYPHHLEHVGVDIPADALGNTDMTVDSTTLEGIFAVDAAAVGGTPHPDAPDYAKEMMQAFVKLMDGPVKLTGGRKPRWSIFDGEMDAPERQGEY